MLVCCSVLWFDPVSISDCEHVIKGVYSMLCVVTSKIRSFMENNSE